MPKILQNAKIHENYTQNYKTCVTLLDKRMTEINRHNFNMKLVCVIQQASAQRNFILLCLLPTHASSQLD